MPKCARKKKMLNCRPALMPVMILTMAASSFAASAPVEFKRIITVGPEAPVMLNIDLPKGDLRITYNRAGEVTITATASAPPGSELDAEFFNNLLTINQEKNRLQIRCLVKAEYPDRALRITYEIQVPYWTEILSKVGNGTQTVAGIMGPVDLSSGRGDLIATLVTKSFRGKTGTGNIAVNRIFGEAVAETGTGDILLRAVGASSAIVDGGAGRVEADGISGTFAASTDKGDLKVKGEPYQNWKLRSVSGNIQVEISQTARVDLNMSTGTGQIAIKDMDLEGPQEGSREYHQKMNGGGTEVEVQSKTGNITVAQPGSRTNN